MVRRNLIGQDVVRWYDLIGRDVVRLHILIGQDVMWWHNLVGRDVIRLYNVIGRHARGVFDVRNRLCHSSLYHVTSGNFMSSTHHWLMSCNRVCNVYLIRYMLLIGWLIPIVKYSLLIGWIVPYRQVIGGPMCIGANDRALVWRGLEPKTDVRFLVSS